MNRNMILPATIAAGLHAMLLGFKPTTATVPPAHVQEKIEWVPVPMPPIEPPDPPPTPKRDLNVDSDPPLPPVPRSPDRLHLIPDNPLGPVVTVDLTPYVSNPHARLIPSNWGDTPGSDIRDVVTSFQLDNQPRALVRTSPTRPLGLNDADARVTVEFIVGKDGRVLAAHVVSSSNPLLEEPCLRAVRMWRFEPGMKRNLPVAFRMSQEFLFNTRD